MFLDSLLLFISGGFAGALVLSEPVMTGRFMAILLFALHVCLFWLVAMPYHREHGDLEDTELRLDNIDII